MDMVKATNRQHLNKLLEECIALHGAGCDLNHIDVSAITNMHCLFSESEFNGDISKWDVSNVTNMTGMFYNSNFSGNISSWNVSNVEQMGHMFEQSDFTGDISKWNTSKVANMEALFSLSCFHGDVSHWDFSSLEKGNGAFSYFHDGFLGYLGVLQGEYDLPRDFPRAALFHQVRSVAEGLDLDPVGAARFIARELQQPTLMVSLPISLDFSS